MMYLQQSSIRKDVWGHERYVCCHRRGKADEGYEACGKVPDAVRDGCTSHLQLHCTDCAQLQHSGKWTQPKGAASKVCGTCQAQDFRHARHSRPALVLPLRKLLLRSGGGAC